MNIIVSEDHIFSQMNDKIRGKEYLLERKVSQDMSDLVAMADVGVPSKMILCS